MKKQKYLIVGDDNYWYATTDEVTPRQLVKIVADTLKMIKKGNQFMPTPASDPNELFAYPVGTPITFDYDFIQI